MTRLWSAFGTQTGAGVDAANDYFPIVDVSVAVASQNKRITVNETKIALGLSSYLPLAGGTMTGAITLAADASSALQPVTKQQLDGIALNLGKRQTVRAATTANIVIASALNSGDVIDGVTLATSDLVLVKNQSTPAQNGVYVVEVSPTRSVEFDTYDEHPGSLIAVQEGTANADTIWLCTSNAGGTLNTTAITFSAGSAGGGLLAANNLSDLPNPATARTNLGVIALAGGTLTGALVLAADPVNPLEASTKQYVDTVAQGLDAKASVKAATTANITLSGTQTVDGIALIANDRCLVKNQSTSSQNGIYLVASGSWTRTTDADAWAELPGAYTWVEQGTTNGASGWTCSVIQGGTLGTTAITFVQFSGAGSYSAGTGLVLTGSVFSIDGTIVGRLATTNTWALAQTFTVAPVFTDASGTRTALGLGTAATSASTAFQAADAQLFSNIPQNSKSAAYTTVLTDGQKHIFHPSADTTARTFTIDSNANVAYPIGTAITFVNQNAGGVITIAITTDTMRLAGAGTTGSRTLAANGIATALKVTSTEWIISGTGLT